MKVLNRERFAQLADKVILEVGCGEGTVLRELLSWGADASRLHGVDLVETQLVRAKRLSPHFQWVLGDARSLPYADHTFEMVFQCTVFTSILDPRSKQAMADEMLRVLRPHGLILWYDFWVNPVNTQTRGIRAAEIRALFPGCDCALERLTLAPPITRALAPYTWVGCRMLEKMRYMCTHYLAAIRPHSQRV